MGPARAAVTSLQMATLADAMQCADTALDLSGKQPATGIASGMGIAHADRKTPAPARLTIKPELKHTPPSVSVAQAHPPPEGRLD